MQTTGFSDDPFRKLSTLKDEVVKIEWNDEFPEADGFTLLHLQITGFAGMRKAWMSYTNATGTKRDVFFRIQSLKNGGTSPWPSAYLQPDRQTTDALLQWQGAQIQFGTMGLYVGSSGSITSSSINPMTDHNLSVGEVQKAGEVVRGPCPCAAVADMDADCCDSTDDPLVSSP